MPDDQRAEHQNQSGMSYWRFAAMIAASVIVMFAIKYLSTYEWSHVWYSEMRTYMSLMMGGAMAVIMLSFMLGMYRNRRINIAIFVGAAGLFAVSLWLVRSQATVEDESYMKSMIPHHSIAILTSERSDLSDYRVCQLAEEIIVAQRREIEEMEWLIDDIEKHGTLATAEAAQQRPVPQFEGTATRSEC
jgi:uncharacterized protein (DUF305 family)